MDSDSSRNTVDVSVVFVNYNTKELTLDAIRAVYELSSEGDCSVEIILVDNASVDGTLDAVKVQYPEVRLIESKVNLGFGGGNNLGAKEAIGRTLFFLNTDTIIEPGAIDSLFNGLASDSTRGVVGAKLLNKDGSYQQSILRLPTVWRIFCVFFWLDRIPLRLFSGMFDIVADPNREQQIEVAHGAALMIWRDLYERLGGFDEDYFMYFEECDLCTRVFKEGYSLWFVPSASVVHLEGGSSRSTPWWIFKALRDSRMIYARKHMTHIERGLVFLIVHVGYGVRMAGYMIAGVFSKRLRTLGKNMFLSYVQSTKSSPLSRGELGT